MIFRDFMSSLVMEKTDMSSENILPMDLNPGAQPGQVFNRNEFKKDLKFGILSFRNNNTNNNTNNNNNNNNDDNKGVITLIKTLEKNKINICLFTKTVSFCHEKRITKITQSSTN